MFSLRQSRQLIFWAVLAGIALIGMMVVTSRNAGKSGGTWICRNGAWLKQGNPVDDMPKTPCY